MLALIGLPVFTVTKRYKEKKWPNDIQENNEELETVNIIDEEIQYQLLDMVYEDDIDAETVTEELGISMDELKAIVDALVKYGLLQYISEDEVEITEKGIEYIESFD